MAWPPQIDPSDTKALQAAVKFLLETLRISYTQENCEHLLAFLKCVQIHEDKTLQYGDLWRDYGAIHNFQEGARKAQRVKRRFVNFPTLDADALDDAYDTINYMLFGIRNAIALNYDEKEAD